MAGTAGTSGAVPAGGTYAPCGSRVAFAGVTTAGTVRASLESDAQRGDVMSAPWEAGRQDLVQVRTSDSEREEVATILRAAVTEGRLTLDEGDGRLARAYAARYREDLRPLTADLPGGGRDALSRTPEAVAATRRGLRLHGAGAVLLAGVLVGLWVLSGAHVFWPLFPLLFITLRLAHHARAVRYGRRWGYRRGPWPGWERQWEPAGHRS